MSCSLLMLLLCALLSCLTTNNLSAEAAKLPDIYWNSSNPIFRIDNTDHIFDVNKKQHDHDQVDLVCPQSLQAAADSATAGNKSSSSSSLAEQERYIIYSVSKEEYDTCRLQQPQSGARVVAVCDQQQGKQRPPFTVTFRSFTPQPNGLEFKAGQDYYFISALLGQNVDQARRFAPCREQNMKVIFKVCCKQTNVAQQQQQANSSGSSQSSQSLAISPLQRQLTGATGQQVLPKGSQLGQTGTSGANSPASLLRAPLSTRRPSVITLRPSLQPAASGSGSGSKQQPQQASLEELLRTLAPASPFGGQQASQQQQQPITVLPIEVLQPPSSESPVQPEVPESERNDIVQNEQQQPQPARSQQQQQQQQLSPQGAARPAFFAFDPTAPPEYLRSYERWAPTALPAGLTKAARNPPQQHQLSAGLVGHLTSQQYHNANNNNQQQQQLEPAQWHLPPPQRPPIQQQTRQTNLGEQQATRSRMQLYPTWSTFDQPASINGNNNNNSPTRELIIGQQTGAGSSSSAADSILSSSAPLWALLLSACSLILLALKRQL